MACSRGVAQLGSAPLWGSGGRGFKSRRSDSQKIGRVEFWGRELISSEYPSSFEGIFSEAGIARVQVVKV